MNFQNVPRKEKLIKGAFRPKLDYLLFADYSQIEYRLLAYYLSAVLGDTSIADAYKAGMDAHEATARLLYDIPPDQPVSDELRQRGKQGNFSVIYMGGVPSILRYGAGGTTEDEARELLRKIREKMPGVNELLNEILATYHKRGYILSIAGRHLTVDPKAVEIRGAKRAEAALLNYLIQGSAAELIRDSLIKIHKFCADNELQSHLVNVVHDENQLDGAWSELELLKAHIPRLMGNELVEEYVPIAVDMEISETTWADKHPFEGE